ncbi:FAD-binding-3 domain-containing protein [Fusarium falciforme]|uniref:FAD-binding-3 domain-containing protein n=1 Tax=Fusarium falciforme TaxID=195108 RepID=UPI0022FFF624|nr:FAD-binding-3 domain-containing protein [Fusarium falciforme]WAO96154.1 FAD-binding-3 domain-containing protein [Fusarium falciforme]
MEVKPEHLAALDIIVVGAGISGLATAISCSLSGHRVTILEAAKELGEVGAGLQITPNASRILKEWGVPASLWKVAAEPRCLAVHRYSDGKILAMEKDFGKKIRSKYRAPFVALHRADLHKALYERSHQLGVEMQLGQKVVQIDFEQTMIVTESGLTAKADLVVAADGLWSQCRQCFLGVEEPPLPTGDLAYRILLHLDDIDDPELREWVSKPAVHFWIGPEAHAVGYSLRAGNMYNIVLLVPDDLPEGVKRQTASVDEMRALFKGWDPILGRFLDTVKKVDKWKLMHRTELQNWVSDESNLVFVGDSCHPMLPYLAQGANSAIEDGAVLGRLLGKINSKDQLPSALKMYERLRKSRGEAIVKEAFKQRDAFHMKDGPEQRARDELFLSQLGKEIQAPFPSRWTCPDVQRWLYGYNVNKELQEATKRGLSKL